MAFKVPNVYVFSQNYAGSTQKSYPIMAVEMSTTMDEANPDTGNTWGLNLMAVECTSVQMSNCQYSKG
jgi:hypothetical protein